MLPLPTPTPHQELNTPQYLLTGCFCNSHSLNIYVPNGLIPNTTAREGSGINLILQINSGSPDGPLLYYILWSNYTYAVSAKKLLHQTAYIHTKTDRALACPLFLLCISMYDYEDKWKFRIWISYH